MTRNSRRTLLKSAAAGAAAIGLVGASRALAGSGTAARGSIGTSSEPLVAYVSDARKGEVVVMVGTREIVRRDPALVARLVAIAKEAVDVVAS
jgi:hypothetical protein